MQFVFDGSAKTGNDTNLLMNYKIDTNPYSFKSEMDVHHHYWAKGTHDGD